MKLASPAKSLLEIAAIERRGDYSLAASLYLDAYRTAPRSSSNLEGLLRCIKALQRSGSKELCDLDADLKRTLGFIPQFGTAPKPRVAFLDHSFHVKTLSSMFFVEELKSRHDVDIFWSHEWEGGAKIDVSQLFIWYEWVICWQVLPQSEGLTEQQLRRLVIVPMWDGVAGLSDQCFEPFAHCLFLSYCLALSKRLRSIGLQVREMMPPVPQYPITVREPNDDLPRVFFWQRTSRLAWRHVKRLLNPEEISGVRICNVADPGEVLPEISEEDVIRYRIQQTKWLPDREHHAEILKSCDLYIAPRLSEGIGLSLIEAMMAGCVPIVHDAPTMNEMVDESIGYVFNVEEPAVLDLTQINVKRGLLHSRLVHLQQLYENQRESAMSFGKGEMV